CDHASRPTLSKICYWPLLACRAARLDLERNDATARLQAALARIRAFPPPATRARIGPWLDGAGARCAADAGIALVVQRVVREVTRLDVGPHVLLRPFQHRAHFP